MYVRVLVQNLEQYHTTTTRPYFDPAQSHALLTDRFDRFISLCGGRCWWSPHTHSHARTNPENLSSAKRKNHTRYKTHEETRRKNLHDHSHAPTIDRFCSFVGHLDECGSSEGRRSCVSITCEKVTELGGFCTSAKINLLLLLWLMIVVVQISNPRET